MIGELSTIGAMRLEITTAQEKYGHYENALKFCIDHFRSLKTPLEQSCLINAMTELTNLRNEQHDKIKDLVSNVHAFKKDLARQIAGS